MSKVAKFGGSSLADANQFSKVAAIVRDDPERRFIVPSAPGKRSDRDTKITDLLYDSYEAASSGNDFDPIFKKIEERFLGIVSDLGLNIDLSNEFSKIRRDISGGASRDYAASRGEYLSGIILSSLLGFQFIDARDVIFFDKTGKLDGNRSYAALARLAEDYEHAVIPGFYGSMPDGTVHTFSRGGSDITGSVVARGTGAAMYENWTDVSGFMVTNPKIVDNPESIGVVTFRELRELSYMGANVLHEDAVFPVKNAGIPINIRNTNDPSHPGTIIVASHTGTSQGPITGIAGRRGFSVITIEKDGMNNEVGFTGRALKVLEKHNISFEHLPSGIDTMGIIIHTSVFENHGEIIAREIRDAVKADSVELISGLALIAVVGRGMVRAKGVAARIFSCIARANINIRMIDQGSSELNIIIGVDEYDFKPAVNAIYNEFFPRPDTLGAGMI